MVQVMDNMTYFLETPLHVDELKLEQAKNSSRDKVVPIGVKKEIENLEKKIKEKKINLAINHEKS